MLKRIVTMLAVATVTVTAFAQQQDMNTISTPVPNVESAKGFRVALIKPFLDYEVKQEFLGVNASSEGDLEKEIGFSVGYAYLPVQKLGFTGNLSYISLDGDDADSDKATLLRIDGNLAYSVNEMVSFKGGLNISNFTDDEMDELDPSIGLQFGAGIQITKNFGVDASYVIMQQYAKQDTIFGENEIRVFEKGIEVALHATF